MYHIGIKNAITYDQVDRGLSCPFIETARSRLAYGGALCGRPQFVGPTASRPRSPYETLCRKALRSFPMKNLVSLFSKITLMVGAVIFFALSAANQCAFGQETGQISGNVTDPSGAIVPNATVTVKNVGTNAVRTVTTGDSGAFVVTGLQPATYEVVIKSPGFQTHTGRVEVTVASKVALDTRLTLGSATTTVEVSAELGGAQTNTQSQELSQIINSTQVSQMPSLTRNAYDFVAISGNVSA